MKSEKGWADSGYRILYFLNVSPGLAYVIKCIKKRKGARVAQRQSACLARMRPWFDFNTINKHRKEEDTLFYKFHWTAHIIDNYIFSTPLAVAHGKFFSLPRHTCPKQRSSKRKLRKLPAAATWRQPIFIWRMCKQFPELLWNM